MKTLVRIHSSSDQHWVGNGFPVRSVFSYNESGRELSPFLLLDYATPHPFPAGIQRRGVEAHPHKGFETVTIAYQGELEHRDSSGGGGRIGAGDVQWMTAGAGIVHEEFHSQEFTARGGTLEMVQLWVNLPARNKQAPAGYQTISNGQIPRVTLAQGAGEVRVIAGEFNDAQGPARTFTPINLWDVQLAADASIELPAPAGHTTAVLVLQGGLPIVGERDLKEADLAVFDRLGFGIALRARANSRLLVMTGEPIDEPIAGYGPFVMNTQSEIQEAFADFRAGRMGHLH